MKNVKLTALAALLAVSGLAVAEVDESLTPEPVEEVVTITPLTLQDFTSGAVMNHHVILPESPMSKDGEQVAWHHHEIIESDRFTAAIDYVSSQTYLSDIQRLALARHGFMFEYVIQHAHDEQALVEIASEVHKTEMCMYFVYSDQMQFVQSQLIGRLSNEAEPKERMLNGSAVVSREIAETVVDEQTMKEHIIRCYSYLAGFEV